MQMNETPLEGNREALICGMPGIRTDLADFVSLAHVDSLGLAHTVIIAKVIQKDNPEVS